MITTGENDVENIIKCFDSCNPFNSGWSILTVEIICFTIFSPMHLLKNLLQQSPQCLLNIKENGDILLTTYKSD